MVRYGTSSLPVLSDSFSKNCIKQSRQSIIMLCFILWDKCSESMLEKVSENVAVKETSEYANMIIC